MDKKTIDDSPEKIMRRCIDMCIEQTEHLWGGSPIDALERAQNQLDNKYYDGARVNIKYAIDTIKSYMAGQPQKQGMRDDIDSIINRINDTPLYLYEFDILEKARDAIGVPDIIMQALRSYRDEHCFDDSEYGIAIDKFLTTHKEIK